MDKDIKHVMQFFTFAHLPEELQEVSRPFCELAESLAGGKLSLAAVAPVVELIESLPDNRERDKALEIFRSILLRSPIIDTLDQLLTVKDAAVRAKLAR